MQVDGIDITVLRSRRRSMVIQIRQCEVVARVPKGLPEQQLRQFVTLKADWIRRQLQEQAARPVPPQRQYCSGERWLFRGDERVLDIQPATASSVGAADGKITIGLSNRVRRQAEKTKALLAEWYRLETQQRLEQRVPYFAEQLGVSYSAIETRAYRSRWGSCDSRGKLSFNRCLIMAPDAILDYVVVHELCHRIEFNHSRRFWALVAALSPDYSERREWLHDNAALLTLD